MAPSPMAPSPPEKKSLQQRQQTMKRLFLVLLVAGLAAGALLSVGVINLMTRFGLTERPQIEQVPSSTPSTAAPAEPTAKLS